LIAVGTKQLCFLYHRCANTAIFCDHYCRVTDDNDRGGYCNSERI